MTLGCWAAAAAPTAGAEEVPLGDVLPESPFVDWLCDCDCDCDCECVWAVPLRSTLEPFRVGGPMVVAEVGVMSMGSRGGGARVELEEGRMGMDLWRLGLCASA
jgi:hypothetical protein